MKRRQFLLAGCAALIATPVQAEWRNREISVNAGLFNHPGYSGKAVVEFPSSENPGTIIIDTGRRRLFYILAKGRAISYGVGVGRSGFTWSGIAHVGRKAEWPVWTPPPEMIDRDPRVAEFADGMPGGPENPLGARAMYLYQGNQDTMFRIHGTREPWTIGLAVSSGCIRMLNSEVIDLYNRVKIGTKVIVL